jgi:carboxyl-terminal processing protease
MMKFPKKRLLLPLFAGLALVFLSTDRLRMWEIAKNMEIFAQAYRAVNAEYVEKTDPNRLMRTAIDSMLGNMDPYTNFFSEAQMERLRIDVLGAWDGIGVEIAKRDQGIIISELIEGYPAQKEGMKIGDVLLEIDGAQIQDQAVEDVEKTLNGKAGTQVQVKIRRPSTGETKSWTLTRQKVVKKNVPYYTMLDDKTAYIVLTTFTEQAADNIANALKELQEKNNVKQVVLDLRDNGGGLLIEAVNICNIFVDKGKEVVTTCSKIAEWDRSFKTLNNPVDTKIPLVVLINEQSASASEIVGGALQDFDRALLVGRKSFGKGLVQNTKDIGYNSKVKLTIAKYYIPSGRCIQALEYKDGRPMEIPDSLIKVFKTANGRPVKDGGGLIPDVKVEKKAELALIKNLKEKHYIFDFASEFRAKQDSIAGPTAFQISDAIFEDFVKFVAQRNYAYETQTQRQLAEMQSELERNSYDANLKTVVQRLRTKVEQEKRQELYKHKEELKRVLGDEIVGRYYFEQGRIQRRLRGDQDVQTALQLLNNPSEFQRILQGK